MSLKNKSTLKKIKVRPGDVVQYTNEYETRIGVVGNINGWWQLESLVDVYFKDDGGDLGIGSLIDFKDLVLVKRREDIKEWWNLLTGTKKLK